MKYLKTTLTLFGEGGEGSATGEATGPATQKTGEIVYGKQESAAPAEETKDPAAEGMVTQTPEERRKAFQDLVRGEYKQEYTEATQAIIDRRFKDFKTVQGKLADMQPLVTMLADKYHVDPNDVQGLAKAIEDDDSYWAQAADEAGMTVEQYKQWNRMKRENEEFKARQQQAQSRQQADAQVQKWVMEAEAVRAKFPKFDLEAETKNPEFMRMLKGGVPIEHAYKVIHYDDLMKDNIQATAAYTEQAVVSNVRARGARPAENGASSQSAAIVKDDVSKLTKKDRAAIAQRVKRGAEIRF
jgi:hypothetical protein